MKNNNDNKLLKRVISIVLAFTIMFTNIPPVKIDLPEFGIHLSFFKNMYSTLFDKDTISANASAEPAAMTVDHFYEASSGTYDVTFSNGIREVTINSAAELLEYSIAYNTFSDHNHDTDTIILSITQGTIWDLVGLTYIEGSNNCGGFQSIGNDSKPFKGKIQKAATDVIKINLDKPFLGTVEQCAEVCELNLSRRTVEPQTAFTPMLATKIQKTQNAASPLILSAILASDTINESTVIRDYAGVIGKIDNNTSVSLTVMNNARFTVQATGETMIANVKSAGSVGFLCGSMGEKASLTASIRSGTNSSYTVTSTGGSAGGLVGSMANGSKLILSNNGLNSITQSITGADYAGGIVGDATGAYIGASDPDRAIGSMTITSYFKAASTTLNGSTASGYLFGSYTNAATSYEAIPADGDTPAVPASTVSDRTFTIANTFRNVSLTFNSNNAGGYFGELNNNVTGATVTFDGGIGNVSSYTDSEGNRLLSINFGSGNQTQGGVICKYIANDLTNTLNIENTYVYCADSATVDKFGGAIAEIQNPSAYVKIENFFTNQLGNVAQTTINKVNYYYSGGLIYDSGSSFVDVTGNIRIKGKLYGGLIYSMPKGVLRLAGTTNLSGVTAEGLIVRDRTNGLIYSKGSGNDDGTGTSWKLIRNNNQNIDDVYTWGEVVRLKSATGAAHLFDYSTNNAVIDETKLETGHYIQIPPITFGQVESTNTTTITDLDDFMRVALYIQHYTASGTTNTGTALVFTTTDMPISSTILCENITLSGNVDLRGTGITGLTRDNGDSERYTGTFTGGSNTITLAIGEAYGFASNGSTPANNENTSSDKSTGKIYRHPYNGLFAKLANGATIQNLTVDGKIYLGNNVNQGHYTGAFGASIEAGTINFTNDTSSIEVYLYGDQEQAYTGGFISRIADSNITLNFIDCTSDVDFYDNSNRKDQTIFFGGFVSMISVDCTYIEVNFDTDKTNANTNGCKISGSYRTKANASSNSYTTVKSVKYGGLISYSANRYSGDETNFVRFWKTRTLNIKKLAVDNLTIQAKAGDTDKKYGCAALLGYEWYGLDVTIEDLTVGATKKCTIELAEDSVSTKMAGLCTIATGHWKVDSVNIQGLDVKGQSSSFGMLVNAAYRPANDKGMPSLYLELTNMKNYVISSDSNKVSFSGITNGLYDELAVYTYSVKTSGRSAVVNDNSIISINTDDNANFPTLFMNGSNCNTYQNQSAYGKTVTHNPNARYYYNLYYIRNKTTKTPAEQLLLWSVYQYAKKTTYKLNKVTYYNGIEGYFTNTYPPAFPSTGSFDMEGLSYYPIDYTSDITLPDNTTLKFYNEQIELGETAGTGYTSSTGTGGIVNDGKARTTSGTDSSHTQHYMMHCGLFRNYISKATTFSTQNLTLKGSVGIYNGGSGFLIGGTLGGAAQVVNFKPEGDKTSYVIELDGAYVYNVGSSTYAPLLINSVETNSLIHIYGLKTLDTDNAYSTKQADSNWYGASSLIGKVGKENGNSENITVVFSKIWLDSRKPNASLSTNQDLTDKYKTSRSIFNRATLLHWFVYGDAVSSGTYNYEYSEDSGTHKHEVTYGQEVYYTIDNNDDYPTYSSSQQLHYLGDKVNFTNPIDSPGSAYIFAYNTFLPYVGDYNKGINVKAPVKTDHTTNYSRYHELNVNLMVSSLDEGCGTYNDPYVIREPGQLLALAKVLKGDTIDSKFIVNLPDKDKVNIDAASGDRNLYWCKNDHVAFSPDGTTYKRNTSVTNNPASSNEYSSEKVRRYLAGAYYQIANDMTLSDRFAGLGVGDPTEAGLRGDYAFHGIIVGKQFTPEGQSTARYPIITNKSNSPLIATSNGSVVKNVTIAVDSANMNFGVDTTNTATFAYNAGCGSYGAVIGKIMGGDNVIDNVPVTFTNTAFTLDTGAQVVPVGGYVGVVVNGGLFFRNMSEDISGLASSDSSTTLATGVSFGTGNDGILSSKQYLYINPIIGRVINGYAVTEGSTYKPSEADVTMKNTAKNYSIADISTSDQVTIDTDSITADSAQDFFILSLIVNSGTGSRTAASDAADLSYNKNTFKTTHIGSYADVGCISDNSKTKINISDAVLFESGYSEMTDASATPYITVKYTSSSANAQAITDSGKSYAISMSGSPWRMPDGYRGIGGFNSANSSYQLGVTSMNFGGSTMSITLNSNYSTYEQTYDNYPTAASCGFGLFNTFVPAANCTVANLTLSGQTKVTAYSSASGSEVALATDSSRDKYLSAGMLAGVKTNANANAFTLDSLTVNTSGAGVYSLQNSGGLIGDLSGAGAVTVTNCNGTNLIVNSAGHSGGFFGKSGSPISINESSGTSTITINSITQSNGTDSWTENSSGGIIGYDVDSIIKNVTVSLASSGTGITLYSGKGGAGGLIGISVPDVTTNEITDCTINDLPVSGRRTGVVVGQYAPPAVKTVSITNVSVNGNTTGSGTNAIVERSADGNVGTIVGYVYKTNLTIENCSSQNYIIKSNDASTGGCVGYVGANSTINLKNYLIDSCVFQSSSQATGGIIGGLGDSGSQLLGYNIAMNSITSTGTKYAADLVGSYSNKTLKIVGFSRNATPTPTTAANYTAVCSNALCVSGTTQDDLWEFPSGSYIIFADYNGKGYDSSGTPNTLNYSQIKRITNSGTDEDPEYTYADMVIPFSNAVNSPYVLINPYKAIDDNTKLTGDGIADSVADLAITNIWSDISSGVNTAYDYAGNIITNQNNETVFSGASFDNSNMSTMNTQLGAGTVPNDFAILVLEDTNPYNSQAIINGYLQLLTNSRFNYADNHSYTNIFSTQLYKMELEEIQEGDETVKKFVRTDDAAGGIYSNLKIDANDRFYMSNNKDEVDTAGLTTMFSLIDIQFYDPTESSAPGVVYHLYVPVLVKKMIKYSFNIATGSGTIYDAEWYGDPSDPSSRYGKILLENLGTPGTLYFTYSYERTLKEWQEAMESGENLLQNYDKILGMAEINAALEDMASDTMLTLVDKNRNGKSYYARFSDAWSSDKLTLYNSFAVTKSSFKNTLGASGTAFEPVSMCELMNISVEAESDGKFISLGNSAAGATVKVDDTYYRLYDKATDENEENPPQRYTLTVINKKGVDTPPESDLTSITLTESYYLSFFTKTSNQSTINYYEITSPAQLTGGAATAKSAERQSAVVLFGNLYQQTDMTVRANPYPNDPNKANAALITDSNNLVRTELQTTVTLTSEASANNIDTKLDDSVEIYQSFVVYLTKHKDNVDTKGVVGAPAATANYTIAPVNESETYPEIKPIGSQRNELNYVEAASGQSIKNYLKNTGGAIITVELVLTYATPDQRSAQFPVDTSTSGQPENYTFVSASSNLAYDPNKTAYSKNQENGTDSNGMRYHIASGKEASMSYNAIADDKGNPYGQLGINANDLDDNTGKVKIKTNAVYVLTDVADEVPIAAYPYVKVSFKLSQKQPQLPTYGNALEIGQYLANVMVKGSGITTATPKKYSSGAYIDVGNTDTEYEFILNRSQLKTNGNENILSIPIEFDVLTGSSTFESQNSMYGNFRIDIKAQCLTDDDVQTGSASATNYIVYTNAKLITEFINANLSNANP